MFIVQTMISWDIIWYKNTPVCHYLCYQLPYLFLTATALPATCHNTCYLFTTLITGTQQVINSYFKKLSTHYSYFSTLFLWFIRHLSTGFVNIVLLIISILHSYPHFYVVQYMLVISVFYYICFHVIVYPVVLIMLVVMDKPVDNCVSNCQTNIYC